MSDRIKASWDEFVEAVLPAKGGFPETQRTEMQKAFYAGAWAVITELQTIDENTPDEVGVKLMNGMYNECVEFKNKIMKDYSERN